MRVDVFLIYGAIEFYLLLMYDTLSFYFAHLAVKWIEMHSMFALFPFIEGYHIKYIILRMAMFAVCRLPPSSHIERLNFIGNLQLRNLMCFYQGENLTFWVRADTFLISDPHCVKGHHTYPLSHRVRHFSHYLVNEP